MSFFLKVRNFKAIDEAEIIVEKTLLYGPNGGGKSSIIKAAEIILKTLRGEEHELIPKYMVRNESETATIELSYHRDFKASLEIRKDDVCKLSIRRGKEEETAEFAVGRPSLPGRLKRLIPEDVKLNYLHVNPCLFSIAGNEIDACRESIFLDVSLEGRSEDSDVLNIVDALKEYGPYFIEDFAGVYRSWVKLGDSWVPPSYLSYGQLRALAIIAAASRAEKSKALLAIEGFEAGMHYDLAIALLDHLKENSSPIILETHLGLLALLAKEYGWKSYYVEGRVEEEVAKSELMKKEVERFGLLFKK